MGGGEVCCGRLWWPQAVEVDGEESFGRIFS